MPRTRSLIATGRPKILTALVVGALVVGAGYVVVRSFAAAGPVLFKPADAKLATGATLATDGGAAEGQAVQLTNGATAGGATSASVLAALPTLASTTPVYMDSNQAPPSNRWFSALAFSHNNDLASFAHPFGLKTQTNGFLLSAARIVPTTNTVFGMFNPDLKVSFGAATWNWIKYYDDMMAQINFKSGSTVMGTLTLTHGSPYAWVNLPAGGTLKLEGDSLTQLKANYYSFTTAGTKYLVAWDGGVTGGANGNALSFTAGGSGGLVSISTQPTGVSTDDLYAAALNPITGTKVEAARSGNNWQTTLSVATKSGAPTYFGLMPNEAAGMSVASVGSFAALNGTMKVYKGNSFTSSSAVKVPASSYDVASFTSAQKATLTTLVKADIAALAFDRPDTYFDGKALAKGATLYELATQLGLSAEAKVAHDKVMARFATWFNVDGCKTQAKNCFIWDPNLRGVVGKEFAFGDEEMNDHHFHYGYWLAAAAIMARYDPTFISQYGAHIDLLARDYANTDRSDNQFPYIRSYDLYLGHSWAAGLSPFADGNNNESSSEAVNAYYGLYQWASARGNTALASTGLWLYNRESAAALAYWVNIDKSQPQYQGFSAPFVSMLWGGKRDYATWFSGAGEAKLAIQVLPLTPAALYLQADKPRVLSNLQAAAPTPALYKDILVGYLGLADASAAQSRFNALTAATDIDDGDTRSNLQAFLYFAQNQSAASAQPISPVAGCSVPVSGASSASFTLNTDAAGSYRTWLRLSGAGSVAVQIDEQCPVAVSGNGSGYNWIGTAAGGGGNTMSLAAGQHTVTVYGQTAGARFDRVLMASDVTCTPTSAAGACKGDPVITPTPGQTTSPAPTTSAAPSQTPTPASSPSTAPTTPPSGAAPSNLRVAASTSSSVTLQWDGQSSASYDILRAGIKIATATGTSFTDTGLNAGTPYLYSVRGGGVTTAEITAVPGKTTPTPTPAALKGDANRDGKVNAVDLSLVLSHWNMNYAATDFNGDGITNAVDLSIMLARWTG